MHFSCIIVCHRASADTRQRDSLLGLDRRLDQQQHCETNRKHGDQSDCRRHESSNQHNSEWNKHSGQHFNGCVWRCGQFAQPGVGRHQRGRQHSESIIQSGRGHGRVNIHTSKRAIGAWWSKC